MVTLSDKVRSEIDHWLTKYPVDQKQSAVLSALHAVQEENGGWVSEELMDAVADYLDMPKVSVYEVATFYSMIHTQPAGPNKISVCKNIACMLCGAENILGHIENKLGIKAGETTADGKITLVMEEECLAACIGAPMMVVNGHYHEHLTPEKVDEILGKLV
jgi:NADH-quinone oxidoreductase subunit E